MPPLFQYKCVGQVGTHSPTSEVVSSRTLESYASAPPADIDVFLVVGPDDTPLQFDKLFR